jgi:hypothetical protein
MVELETKRQSLSRRKHAVSVPWKKILDGCAVHSTVTDFARLRGWSTSVPFATAV